MVNTNKIKGRMAELGISQLEAAEFLGIKQPTFSQKCNNIRPLKVTEAQALIKLLHITHEEVTEYFFM